MTLFQRIGLDCFILALGLVLGTFLGYRYATGQAAKAKVEKLETTIEVINDQVKQDTQLIYTQAERRVKKTQESKQIETQGVMDASLKATATCARDVESYGLLIRALDTANGTGDSSSVSAGMPSTSKTSESLGSGDSSVGVSVD